MAKAISKRNGERGKPIAVAITSGMVRNEIVIQRLPQPRAPMAHQRCQVSRRAAGEVLWRVRIHAPPAAISSQSIGRADWATYEKLFM